ncbi:DUF2541 domain-containing protein [Hyphomicrobium sp. LHD-15]|uniref:DUF2541 family protein n=1 Tax=Hyphomicrobium sp. LHD-15 TaxID=3072142 RepID=UPI00280E2FA7|nr:DUF2541 domain-containing protein [Hyphomicrobium sp. LHD-15]MDQ8699047.1 DUF2541 domain-containing protein [Hyphomicrobium sp. LHD-15]
MFPRLRVVAVAAGLFVAVPGTLSLAAPSEKLVVIGTHTIDLSGSGVSIDVSAAPGAYRGIRIRAKSGAPQLDRIQIIYRDGKVYNEQRPIALSKGERTRAIPETSTDTFIDTVNIVNKIGSGKAIVEVLGIQSQEGAAKERPAPASGDVSAEPAGTVPDPAAPGTLKDGRDVMFGYQNVGFGIDRDVIKVGGDLGKFNRIRLRVLGNDVHVNALRVVFVDGQEQNLAVDADLKANSRSQWFEINGDRFIREIQMTYRSHPNLQGQARVEVTGEYAKGWLGVTGEGRNYHQGWVLLGAQTAGFTGFDRDVINIGENEGGFTRLRIEAVDRAITLKEIRVKYLSGPDEVFTMRERVDPGKPYGPLEFKGGKAPIKSIEASYRSRFDLGKGLKNALDGHPAVVQIWGQH